VFVVLAAAAVVFLRPKGPDHNAVAAGAWVALPASGLVARSDPAVVWTRKAMIVWGGESDAGVMADGASFDLPSQTWTPLPPAPLAPRRGQSAVWTGTKMLVYGGLGRAPECPQLCALGDGAAYDAVSASWAPMAPPPLAPRSGHTAVWLQNRMIVWGGAAEGGAALDDGASYDPETNSWTLLPPAPIAARVGHRTVATTHRMLVWGGSSASAEGGTYADGAIYSPFNDAWTPMAAAPASLVARDNFVSVWTGEQMLVWGGAAGGGLAGDGAAYTLSSDSWTPLAPSPLSARAAAGAVWTGRDMLVWGGSGGAFQADGALYNPTDDAWSRLVDGPLAGRRQQAMVWTGQQLLVWGGQGGGGKLSDGAVLTLTAS
jgi:N-acetylneuraminic acid mutarotase